MKKRTHEDFLEKIREKWGEEYIILGCYKKIHDKILVKHNTPECGIEFEIEANTILNCGSGCKVCGQKKSAIKRTHSIEKVIERFNNRSIGEYELISEFVNITSKVKILCCACGEKFERVASHILYNGISCPQCSQSSGAKIIKRYLKNNNLIFIEEYKFIDCKNIKPTPFDFAIFNLDKTLNC